MIISENFLRVLENVLVAFQHKKLEEINFMPGWSSYKKILSISWIVSDRSLNYCQQICDSQTVINLLVKILEEITADSKFPEFETSLYTVKSILGILHNVNRLCDSARIIFRKTNLMCLLQKLIESSIDMVRAKSLIILSYIISDTEIDALNADDKILKFLITILMNSCESEDHCSRKFGMCASEIIQGLNNLSVNDENKVRLVRLGVVSLYLNLLTCSNDNLEEKQQAVTGLWRLSFHQENKQVMRQSQCLEVLEALKTFDDQKIKHAACGTLWELRPVLQNLQILDDKAELEASCPHIMISYQWDSQAIMIKVKDRLKHAGYKVWMDVEHMTGSTLEAMALAVEKAAVILICMSQKYKDSPNCRSEAEYVYKLRKSFIPLRLQTDYMPDGWLGMLIGTKLYFDFYKDTNIDQQIPNLIRELGDRGKISAFHDNGIDSTDSSREKNMTPGYVAKVTYRPVQCSKWTSQEVCQWIKDLKLTTKVDEFLMLDGDLLHEMRHIMDTAPDYFYRILQTEFHMTFIDVLKFTKALRNL